MKTTLQLVIVLTLISLLAGGLLAWVHRFTATPIAEAARRERLAAIANVLPPHDNEPDRDVVRFPAFGETWSFHFASETGRYVGCAFETASDQGYAGAIRIMVGVAADGNVHGIEILEHAETPGLGARIVERSFRSQFAGQPAAETRWTVSRDGGDIDEITAATLSSRAVTEAVRKGLDAYRQHEAEIREAACAANGVSREVGADALHP